MKKVKFFLLIALFACADIKNEFGHYYNGNVKYEKYVLEGKNHGPAKSYYENGNLEFEGEFKHGFRVGQHITYFENLESPKEIAYYQWNGTSSYLNKLEFYDKDGLKTLESSFNPKMNLKMEISTCCESDSTELKISLLNPKHDYVYARIGNLDESFDFISDNKIIQGENSEVLIKGKCLSKIEGMFFDWRIEFITDTTGVTRAEHTYFSYNPNCTITSSL